MAETIDYCCLFAIGEFLIQQQSEVHRNRLVSGRSSAMKKNRYTKSLRRGCLGGMFGGLLYTLTLPSFSFIMRSGKLLLVLLLMVPITAIVGTVIGGLIWWLHTKSGRNIRAPLRALIGAGFTVVLAGFLSVIGAMNSHTDYGATERGSWNHSEVFYWILLGILLGAVPGIMVGGQNGEKPKQSL